MFGLSELGVQPPQSIPLATRKRNSIANSQGGKVAYGRIQAFRDLCQSRRWEFRCDSEGIYNCAGLVWATRRTGISESSEWLKVLREDDYRQLVVLENLAPDDLALYRDVDDNTYLHVARIVRLIPGVSSSSAMIPIVLSKWGHDLGECLHQAYDHGLHEYKVDIEFWTDRRNDATLPSTTRSIIV